MPATREFSLDPEIEAILRGEQFNIDDPKNSKKIYDVDEGYLAQIPVDENGWLKRDEKGVTLFHAVVGQGYLEEIPATTLSAIPLNEDGWLATNPENSQTVVHTAIELSSMEDVPQEVLDNLSRDETGWFRTDNDGETLFEVALLDSGTPHLIPKDVKYAFPVNENGWLRASGEHGTTVIESAVLIFKVDNVPPKAMQKFGVDENGWLKVIPNSEGRTQTYLGYYLKIAQFGSIVDNDCIWASSKDFKKLWEHVPDDHKPAYQAMYDQTLDKLKLSERLRVDATRGGARGD